MKGLKAASISKRFGQRQAVRKATFEVQGGEVVGLLGPNGAGKTTAFYMVAGLLSCDAGEILLDGADVTRFPVHRRALLGLGYLPQEASVFRKLSVEQNVLAILELTPFLNCDDLDRAGRRDELDRLIDEFHLHGVRKSIGVSLSGGERRRVEIARTLARSPRYVLLDEPFAGIDPISVSEIQGIIAQLAERGIGVLITDHNVRETLGICNRGYILHEGVVIASGAPNRLLENPEVRAVYLGECAFLLPPSGASLPSPVRHQLPQFRPRTPAAYASPPPLCVPSSRGRRHPRRAIESCCLNPPLCVPSSRGRRHSRRAIGSRWNPPLCVPSSFGGASMPPLCVPSSRGRRHPGSVLAVPAPTLPREEGTQRGYRRRRPLYPGTR